MAWSMAALEGSFALLHDTGAKTHLYSGKEEFLGVGRLPEMYTSGDTLESLVKWEIHGDKSYDSQSNGEP